MVEKEHQQCASARQRLAVGGACIIGLRAFAPISQIKPIDRDGTSNFARSNRRRAPHSTRLTSVSPYHSWPGANAVDSHWKI
jgi:hypothetical protein